MCVKAVSQECFTEKFISLSLKFISVFVIVEQVMQVSSPSAFGTTYKHEKGLIWKSENEISIEFPPFVKVTQVKLRCRNSNGCN